ncbi:C-C chemokine receptor type 10 [Malaclemys terrapin pileata]|uniref:C-C chemokine receptor type 10 n=1 Tax=Malaclemys terrapin pileata TaxID=2991368 RepID=UPI0023A7D099|nr:C-C chemokine receptor type 10 [Malaclemys terrapin pileata]
MTLPSRTLVTDTFVVLFIYCAVLHCCVVLISCCNAVLCSCGVVLLCSYIVLLCGVTVVLRCVVCWCCCAVLCCVAVYCSCAVLCCVAVWCNCTAVLSCCAVLCGAVLCRCAAKLLANDNDHVLSSQTFSPWAAEPPVTTDYYYDEDEQYPEWVSSLPELCEKGSVQSFARTYQPVVYLLLSALGVAGNGLVLLIHARYRQAHSVTDVCLLHLAMADLLLLLTLPFAVAGALQGWLLGTDACRTMQGFYALNFYSGFLFLTCISVDRYMAIVRAPAAYRLHSRARCYGWLAAGLAWLLSTLLALPQFVYSRAEGHQKPLLCMVLFPAGVSKAAKGATNLAQVILGFVLPFLVMASCYTAVARTLLAARSFQRHKALRLILALVLFFVALELPHSLMVLLDTADILGSREMSCAQSRRKDLALVVISGLAFARCCLNPVLYAFMGVRFRKELRLLASDVGCVGRAQDGQHPSPRCRSQLSTCLDMV